MVRQLREIQLWIAARDESISRYGTFLGSSSAIPSSSLSSAKPDVVRSGIGVLDESLIGHIEILQHIKEEMEDDFTLLSLDETPEKKVPMLPPKQAASPTRQSKPQFAWSGDYTHGSMLAKSESPPQLDTSSRFQIEHKVNTITAPKSASFASRLGNLPPSAVSSRIDIDGYSNNLRSSINAYDLHAE